MSARLTMLHSPRAAEWQAIAIDALRAGGLESRARGRAVEAWPVPSRSIPRSEVTYSDGVYVHSLWLGPGKHGLSVTPRRYYFRGAADPIRQQEAAILGALKRPDSPQKNHLSLCLRGLELLDAAGVASSHGIFTTEEFENDVLALTKAVGAGGLTFCLQPDMWRGLREHKCFRVPPDFEVVCIKDDSAWNASAEQYLRFLTEDWLREAGLPHGRTCIRIVGIERAIEQLSERVDCEPSQALQAKVFLVPLSGRPGDPLPDRQARVVDILERSGYQFRSFSYENAEPKWSSRAQVASLLQAAGGVAYQLALPLPDTVSGAHYVGVDIGHSHSVNSRKMSRVVVSILDEHANFLCAVYAEQRLDESIPGRLLERLLTDARLRATALTGRPMERSIILRDGRMPSQRKSTDRESPEIYRRVLGEATTLVEIRKGDNPVMFMDDRSPRPAPAGTACTPSGAQVRFVVAHDAFRGFPTAYKIHTPEGCDNLGIGLTGMARIVAGLCYSPSLGLKPHLPGPIYWADGVASTAADSYKFRGQRVYALR